MLSYQEIEAILKAELDLAQSRHDSARAEFARVCQEIPGGIPHPGGTQCILIASRNKAAAQENLVAALKQFNEFILNGKIPENIACRKGSGA